MSAALDLEAQAAEFHGFAQADPVAFVRDVLGGDPWPVQERIVRSVFANRRTAVPSCHASGKSWISARIILAFLYAFPGAKVISTAPTDRQVRAILWSEIGAAHANAGLPLGGDLNQQELRLARDWFAMGFTADEYDDSKFQGFHAPHILIVVDEAAGVSPSIMEQIEGIASGGDAHILLIGNPTDPGSAFAADCAAAETQTIPIDAFDTPNFTAFGLAEADLVGGRWREKVNNRPLPYPQLITPEWAAEVFAKWGPKSPRYQARVRGRFPEVVEHAVYGEEMRRAKTEARVTHVPHDERLPVDTAWDLGRHDATAIWFFQVLGREVRLVKYVEGTGRSIPEWWRELQILREQKRWTYGEHIAPFDIEVTEIGTGKTRLETARGLGLHFRVVPRTVKIGDGIDLARSLLGRCVFDQSECAEGIQALSSYRYEFDEVRKIRSPQPVHDWASHGADAFRTLAAGLEEPQVRAPARRRNYQWMA